MDLAIFPPFAAQVMLILVGVISIVALVVGAYNYSIIISGREEFNKIAELEREVKILHAEIKDIKGRIAEYQLKDAVPLDKDLAPAETASQADGKTAEEAQPEVWQQFVDDFNNLAASMDIPKAAEACANFVQANKLHLLVCVEPQNQTAGARNPVYAPVDELDISNYWAWPVPGQDDAYVVVPNPLPEYDEKLHNEGGMKETFASNYETGTFHQIQVKLPARFQQQLGVWNIIQPGVIRVK